MNEKGEGTDRSSEGRLLLPGEDLRGEFPYKTENHEKKKVSLLGGSLERKITALLKGPKTGKRGKTA